MGRMRANAENINYFEKYGKWEFSILKILEYWKVPRLERGWAGGRLASCSGPGTAAVLKQPRLLQG